MGRKAGFQYKNWVDAYAMLTKVDAYETDRWCVGVLLDAASGSMAGLRALVRL